MDERIGDWAQRRILRLHRVMRSLLRGGLAFALVLLGASVGSAEPSRAPDGVAADTAADTDRLATARRLFAEGKEKMDRGEWDGAVERFLAATRIKDTPGLRYHIAVCEERAGRLLQARTQYEAARRLLEIRPAPDVDELLGPALRRLEQKIPRLRIVLSASAAPELVAVDGVELPDWSEGDAMPLDPGEHEVRVQVPGYLLFSTRITLAEGQHRTLPVVPEEVRRAAASGAPEASPASWRTPLLVTGAALGATGLGLGVWGLFDRDAALQELEWAQAGITRLGDSPEACVDASGGLRAACDDRRKAMQRRDRATSVAVGGFVAFGVGAAITAASVFLFPESPVEVGAVASRHERAFYLTGIF